MKNDWKNRLGMVFSTNPDFNYEYENTEEEMKTLEPQKQNLKVLLDKKARKGKTVTIIEGFIGKEDDLKELGKVLKTKCGVGGTVKDSKIIIQGDFKEKISTILNEKNYKVK
ncbi:MAG: translation initiation factor [Bacteroidales bacterium]|nr:translation initiation factor [Bacteroidales bacterium]